jgi:hypothetical protein
VIFNVKPPKVDQSALEVPTGVRAVLAEIGTPVTKSIMTRFLPPMLAGKRRKNLLGGRLPFSRMATPEQAINAVQFGTGFLPLEDGELLAKSSRFQSESMARHRPDKLCPDRSACRQMS